MYKRIVLIVFFLTSINSIFCMDTLFPKNVPTSGVGFQEYQKNLAEWRKTPEGQSFIVPDPVSRGAVGNFIGQYEAWKSLKAGAISSTLFQPMLDAAKITREELKDGVRQDKSH